MKIHESPVSYNTPLRKAQVQLMAHWCRKLQSQLDGDSKKIFSLSSSNWVDQGIVQEFFLTAEACGFVCKEWDAMESLSTRIVNWEGVPKEADLKWLRYFIHSLVLDEKPALAREVASRMESVTLLLGKKHGYTDLAEALEAQLP